MIEKIAFGKDNGKPIFKLKNPDLPNSLKFFNKSDILLGTPMSNVAVAFIYTWKSDEPPENIKDLFIKVSNYSYITGYWRTTNGAKYVFRNLLLNPNVNKLVVCIFDHKDNGHLLVDALRCFWKNGLSKEGNIISSKAANPRFEGLSAEALERIRKQIDLVIIENANSDAIDKTLKACIQEPENKVEIDSIMKSYSSQQKTQTKTELTRIEIIPETALYDNGARFSEPYVTDIANIDVDKIYVDKIDTIPESEVLSSLGLSITSENIDDALKKIVKQVYQKGSVLKDQRKITIHEERSLIVVIKDPLAKVPEHYSKQYLEKYKDEFMNGLADKNNEDFVYTYHERIFKKWGNQPEKIIEQLKQNQNTRRAIICLWDPAEDLGSQTPPCLNLLWFCVRSSKLECHVVYRSHHIATVDSKGNIIPGEGAFVPNLYAISHLHKMIAEKTLLQQGPLVLTDLSGHLYVCD